MADQAPADSNAAPSPSAERQPALVAPKRSQRPAKQGGTKATVAPSSAPTLPAGRVNVTFRTHRAQGDDSIPLYHTAFTCSTKDWGTDDLYLEICSAERAAAVAASEHHASQQLLSASSVLDDPVASVTTPSGTASKPQVHAVPPAAHHGGVPPQFRAAGGSEDPGPWVCKAMPRPECPAGALSIDEEYASNGKVVASLIKQKSVARAQTFAEAKAQFGLSHIELSFRDTFLSRSDMLLVDKFIRRRVVFLGAFMDCEGHAFTITSMLRAPAPVPPSTSNLSTWTKVTTPQTPEMLSAASSPLMGGSGGGGATPNSVFSAGARAPAQATQPPVPVVNGIVTENTIISFESVSFVQTIVIMLSQEMWLSTPDGRIALDWTLDAFLPQLTDHIHKHKTAPIVRIMYVGRLTNLRDDFVHSFFLSRKQTNIDELSNEARSQMTILLRGLSQLTDVSNPTKAFAPAIDSNFLETINLVLERYSHHQVDRRLNLTGQRMTIVTAGKGIFRVSNELAQLTAMRMMDNAIQQCVVVCIGRPPLHKAPLLEYHGADKGLQMQRSLKLERNRFYYESPKWAECLFFCPPAIVTDRTPTFELTTQAQWLARIARSGVFYGGIALPACEGPIEPLEVRRRAKRKAEAAARLAETMECAALTVGGVSPSTSVSSPTIVGSIFSRASHANTSTQLHGGVGSGSRTSSGSGILTNNAGSGNSLNNNPTVHVAHANASESHLGPVRSKPGTAFFSSSMAASKPASTGAHFASLSQSPSRLIDPHQADLFSTSSTSLQYLRTRLSNFATGNNTTNAGVSSTLNESATSSSRLGMRRFTSHPNYAGNHAVLVRDKMFKGDKPPYVEASWFTVVADAAQHNSMSNSSFTRAIAEQGSAGEQGRRLLPLGEYILDADMKNGSLVLELRLPAAGGDATLSALNLSWRPEIATDASLFATLKSCFRSNGKSNTASEFANSLQQPRPADISDRRLVLRQAAGCPSVRILTEEELHFEFNANIVVAHVLPRVTPQHAVNPLGSSGQTPHTPPLLAATPKQQVVAREAEGDRELSTPTTADDLFKVLNDDFALKPTVAHVVPSFNVLFALQPADPYPRDDNLSSAVRFASYSHLRSRIDDRTADGAFTYRWGAGHPRPSTDSNWAVLCRCPLMPVEVAHQGSLNFDREAFHDNPYTVPASTFVTFQELILQRLHQGYQLVSLSDTEAFLTLWHQHQRLKKNDDGSVSVLRSLHRGVYSVDVSGVRYTYLQWNLMTQAFEIQKTLFASQLGPRTAFPWSELDMCLAQGEFCCDREEFKGRQLMFAIIPTNEDTVVPHAAFDMFLSSRFSKFLVPKVTAECVWGHSDAPLEFRVDEDNDVPESLMPVRLEQPAELAVRENEIDPVTGRLLKSQPPIARVQHVEVSLSRTHHEKCAFHIMVSWLVCGSPLVSDWIKSLQHTAPKYNLRVVGVPCRYDVTLTNRLKGVVRVPCPSPELRVALLRYCVETLRYIPDTTVVHSHCRLLHPSAKSYVVSLPNQIQWGENFMVETGTTSNVEQLRDFMAGYDKISRELNAHSFDSFPAMHTGSDVDGTSLAGMESVSSNPEPPGRRVVVTEAAEGHVAQKEPIAVDGDDAHAIW